MGLTDVLQNMIAGHAAAYKAIKAVEPTSKVSIAHNSIAFVPGYNVRVLIVVQTPSQLDLIYTQDGRKIMLKTLAVRIGEGPTRGLYAACLVLPFAFAAGLAIGLDRRFGLLALLSVAAAVRPIRRVLAGASGPELIGALGMTGALQLSFGLLLAVGIAL